MIAKRRAYPLGIVGAAPAPERAPRDGGEAAPPTLIGGVNSQKMDLKGHERVLGIDWIQGTIDQKRLSELYDYLCDMAGCEPEWFNHGILGFQRHAIWHPYGITLAWDVDERNLSIHHSRAVLQLTGTSCGCFPAESLYQFCWDLCVKFAFKCSRVDLCFDDYERIITPQQVYTQCCIGEEKKYSGFRRHRYIDEEKSNGEKSGDTLYFGARGKDGSGKFMRCYDKDLESKGVIDSIRWEAEFSKERANAVFFKIALSLSLQEFVTNIAAFIGGVMDFIERKGKNLDRAERLAFWDHILEILGSAAIRNPRPVKTVEKAVGWMEHSVFASAQMVRLALGDEKFMSWLDEGIKEAKVSKLQKRVVEEFWIRNGVPDRYELVPF